MPELPEVEHIVRYLQPTLTGRTIRAVTLADRRLQRGTARAPSSLEGLEIRAIRRHVPDACLLQTEDLGRSFSTPPLREQANYENSRRWLSLDLLHGRIDRTHPWRRRFEDAGVPAYDLDELATGEAAPDLIGIVKFKDRFAKPTESGYRDLQMSVRMSNGHIAELRLHLKSLDEITKYEHAHYEVRRDLEAIANDENRPMTTEEGALRDALLARERVLFWNALQGGL